MSGAHVFVDESERGPSYYVAAAVFASGDLDAARRQLRALLRPGMRRLHMTHEKDAFKKRILTTLPGTGVRARLYTCRAKPTVARPACLAAVVRDAVSAGAERLVLEDLSQARHDRQLIRDTLSKAPSPATLRYEHLAAHADPLLWVADALAWSAGAGAAWRKLAEPMIDQRHQVDP